MGNFVVYYHLPSRDKYLTRELAKPQDDFSGLEELLDLLGTVGEDVVNVDLVNDQNRLEFRLSTADHIRVELHDSGAAGIFSKDYPANRAKGIVALLPDVIANPRACGFNFEYW